MLFLNLHISVRARSESLCLLGPGHGSRLAGSKVEILSGKILAMQIEMGEYKILERLITMFMLYADVHSLHFPRAEGETFFLGPCCGAFFYL